LISPGILFLLTLASGVWLSHSGKPLNTIIFTLHKLIALAAVIVTAIQVYKILHNTEIHSLLISLIIFIGLCVLALFATGAMMSIGKPAYHLQLTIHKVAQFLVAISLAVMVFLLTGRKL
jgi:hypothetical protein